MSVCELCGDFVERPNVIGGKVVCHLCTIRQLRIIDNAPMNHPVLGIPVKPDGSVFIPTWRNKGHWTFGCNNGHGYLCVKYRGKKYKVHRLVLDAFVGPAPKDKPEADHIDRNPLNNNVSNLRWVSRCENCRNTMKQDRVKSRGLPCTFEDRKAYSHGSCKQYYDGHRTDILEKKKEYRKAMKLVVFADGPHWIPRPAATELLKIPKKFRIF